MWFNILRDRKGGGLDGIIVALIMVALVLILLLGGVWKRLEPEISGLIDASAQRISEYSNIIKGGEDETGGTGS